MHFDLSIFICAIKQHLPGDPLTKKRVSMEHRRYSSPPMHMESCASCRKKGGGPLFLVTPPLSSADAVAARDAATKRAVAKRVVEPPIMTCSSLLWCVISFVRERISSVSVQGKRALRAIHDESNRIHYTCVCEQEEHVCEILILTRSQRERQKREGRPKLSHRAKSVMPIHANGLEQAQRPTADSTPILGTSRGQYSRASAVIIIIDAGHRSTILAAAVIHEQLVHDAPHHPDPFALPTDVLTARPHVSFPRTATGVSLSE